MIRIRFPISRTADRLAGIAGRTAGCSVLHRNKALRLLNISQGFKFIPDFFIDGGFDDGAVEFPGFIVGGDIVEFRGCFEDIGDNFTVHVFGEGESHGGKNGRGNVKDGDIVRGLAILYSGSGGDEDTGMDVGDVEFFGFSRHRGEDMVIMSGGEHLVVETVIRDDEDMSAGVEFFEESAQGFVHIFVVIGDKVFIAVDVEGDQFVVVFGEVIFQVLMGHGIHSLDIDGPEIGLAFVRKQIIGSVDDGFISGLGEFEHGGFVGDIEVVIGVKFLEFIPEGVRFDVDEAGQVFIGEIIGGIGETLEFEDQFGGVDVMD